MARRRLVLRSGGAVASAYILAPIAGIVSFWLVGIVYDIWNDQVHPIRELLGLPWLFLVGGFICLIVEILVVTPLLLAFDHYRWTWLNGWTAAAIGFLVGGALPFALEARSVLNGDPFATWLQAILTGGAFGLVGLVFAVVFRLVAVKTEEQPSVL